MCLGQQIHDISDGTWEKIKPHTIGEKGTRGGNAKDTRQSINGVFLDFAYWFPMVKSSVGG